MPLDRGAGTGVLRGRGINFWASAMLGLTGLTRETNLLAFFSLLDPAKRSLRYLTRYAFYGLLACAPLAFWMVYLHLRVVPSLTTTGSPGNFTFPLAGLGWKWAQTVFEIVHETGWHSPVKETLLVMLGLTVQSIYLVLRPAISKPAWRIGAAFVILMIFLGSAVWEGYQERCNARAASDDAGV